MTEQTAVIVDERIRQLLRHLGINQAHLACRLAQDWTGLAAKSPEVISSLTVAGGSFDRRAVEHLAAKLLVVTGDQGPIAEAVKDSMNRLPGAELVRLDDYEIRAWSDVAAERVDELGGAMLEFLVRMTASGHSKIAPLREGDGEIGGRPLLGAPRSRVGSRRGPGFE